MNLLEMTPSQMAGMDFDCTCGRHHRVGIEKILVGSGVLQETGVVLQNAGAKKVYLLEDVNTKAAAGEKVFSLLSALGISVHERVFPVPLVPDEACV
ncbi:MAG: sn-glycerol-1-phosphate dehydrogenase, partial [Oscillospiraceae bacterium]